MSPQAVRADITGVNELQQLVFTMVITCMELPFLFSWFIRVRVVQVVARRITSVFATRSKMTPQNTSFPPHRQMFALRQKGGVMQFDAREMWLTAALPV